MSNSNLLSNGKLGIPETLAVVHDGLTAQLAKASAESGRLGKAAKRLNELCLPHFAKEEENIFRVFGLLHDLATERLRPGAVMALPVISELRARRDTSRGDHQAINLAIEDLMQKALAERNESLVRLALALKDHEKDEDEVLYPTIISIGQSLRQGLGI